MLNNSYIQKAYGCAGIGKRLIMEITTNCQFKCSYCLKRIPLVRKVSHTKSEYIKIFFDICRKYNIYNNNEVSVYIAGGEPTTSPYFLDIVKLCAQCEFVKDINLLTNGYTNSDVYIQVNNICSDYNKRFINNITYHFNKLTKLEDYIHKTQYLLDNGVNSLLSIIIDIDNVDVDDILNIEQYLMYDFIREVYSIVGKHIPDEFTFIHKFNSQKTLSDNRKIKIITNNDNIVYANKLAIETTNEKCIGETFNITIDEEPVSLLDLVKMLYKYCNKKPNYVLVDERSKGDIDYIAGDNTKAKNLLGYRVVKTFEEGIKDCCEWFLKQNRDKNV
jgi:organic radical activating enzyme